LVGLFFDYFYRMEISYSFIIPVYNRPIEVLELLESFQAMQFDKPYEIVIVEDGSTETSKEIVDQFNNTLNISYYFKENSGPGDSRNYGMRKAKGNYFIVLDSDVILPSHYLATVDQFLTANFVHCFGGADAAHDSFSNLQKAINYVMTSFFTTGGIRGNKKSVSKFEPRSFNMGISKVAFEKTNGFSKIHPGEDPDLSQRITKAGYDTAFLPDAHVYHKRRISWKKFHIQVQKFGMVRPILTTWHPNSAKITYWFPSLFVLFCMLTVLATFLIHWFAVLPLAIYVGFIFLHASLRNKSLIIGFLAVIALFVQFFGYGLAFMKSSFYIRLLKKDPQKQFPHLFFS